MSLNRRAMQTPRGVQPLCGHLAWAPGTSNVRPPDMRLPPTKIASLLFALSAAGPIGVWVILLFAAVPAGQTPLENATAMLAYVFADPEVAGVARAFYVLLAILPALFACLSLATWRCAAPDRSSTIWRTVLGMLATTAAVFVCWPVAITSVLGTYYGTRRAAVS